MKELRIRVENDVYTLDRTKKIAQEETLDVFFLIATEHTRQKMGYIYIKYQCNFPPIHHVHTLKSQY